MTHERIFDAHMCEEILPSETKRAFGEEGAVDVTWRCDEGDPISKDARVIYLRRHEDRLIIAAEVSPDLMRGTN